MAVSLFIHLEKWPIAGKFAISRGAKTTAEVVVAELADGRHRGRGECVPYARYGETVEGVAAAIEAMRGALAGGLDRMGLQARMPAGAARNALDCAFWDLQAKRAGRPVHALAGLPSPRPLVTAYTISLDRPDTMAAAAATRMTIVDGIGQPVAGAEQLLLLAFVTFDGNEHGSTGCQTPAAGGLMAVTA